MYIRRTLLSAGAFAFMGMAAGLTTQSALASGYLKIEQGQGTAFSDGKPAKIAINSMTWGKAKESGKKPLVISRTIDGASATLTEVNAFHETIPALEVKMTGKDAYYLKDVRITGYKVNDTPGDLAPTETLKLVYGAISTKPPSKGS